MLEKYKDKLIAVDLDGTLCNGESWTDECCMNAIPRQEIIDRTNEAYCSGAHIIIYTARPEWFRASTAYWLSKNKVRYHALMMNPNKMGADVYVDDKAIRPEEF
jgi:uncharacterized HAD superfamily protein